MTRIVQIQLAGCSSRGMLHQTRK